MNSLRISLIILTVLATSCGNFSQKKESMFSHVPVSRSAVDFKKTFTSDPDDITGFETGAGVSVGDINNDGLPDLVFAGGNDKSRLFLNKGNLRFDDITQRSGIFDGIQKGRTDAILMADINGDGWLDLYFVKYGIQGNKEGTVFSDYGANLLFINQGNLTFKEKGKDFGLNIIGFTVSANFFDYDNDGDLDMFLLNNPESGNSFDFNYYLSPPRLKVLGNRFFENIDNHFEDVTENAGFKNERCLGQSVSVADINNDGWLDIYIANDFFGKDYLYINNGNKTFTDRQQEFLPKSTMSSMGSDFGDINNDGWLDLFSGEMLPENAVRRKMNVVPFSLEVYNYMTEHQMAQYPRNMLQLNMGGKTFRDIGCIAGIEATEWSWGCVFGDYDNDGEEDLFVANGIKRDLTNMDFVKTNYGADYQKMADPNYRVMSREKMERLPSVKTPNYIFKNNGNLTFANMNEPWGLSQPVHSRGVASADLDNDGDLDLIINNIDTIASIYENNADKILKRNFLKVRLMGEGKNSFGLGSRVYVHCNGKLQMKQLSGVRGFSSSSEPLLHFGLDTISIIDSIVVVWLGGKTETLYNVKPNQLMVLKQVNAKVSPSSEIDKTEMETLFTDVTVQMLPDPFIHHESAYSDFKQHRLFHRMFSREGPGITVADVNSDGLDDFFICGGANEVGTVYIQNTDGSFSRSTNQPDMPPHYFFESTCCSFLAAGKNQPPNLIVGFGSSEFGQNAECLQACLFTANGAHLLDDLPVIKNYTSCISASAFDNDSDMDIFIGGRINPEKYPVSPLNYLLKNENGKFADATDAIAPELKNIGMVTGSTWADYNNDNLTDLILVGEWMPVTIFENKGGIFSKVNGNNGLQNTHGWWNSIVSADFDKDGDIDFIAGNHGLNSVFKATEKEPVTIYSGDFDRNGTNDPIVFHYIAGKNVPFVNRDLFCEQMPVYNNKFYTFENYAKASLHDILTPEQQASSYKLHASLLASVYIENLGEGNFSVRPLPNEAQLAPINGIQPVDINADGNLDAVVVGNSFSQHYEYGNLDALGGLVLMGDGKGNFKPVPASESGFTIRGDARGIAKIYNKALNTTLFLVAQNNDTLKFFRVNGKNF